MSTASYRPSTSEPGRAMQSWEATTDHYQSVSSTERLISALAGGGLVAAGLARRGVWGLGMAAVGGSLLYRGVSGHCMVYEMLGINTALPSNPAVGVPAQRGFKHETSIIVNRSPEELYEFWRNVENLPRVMRHLVSVREIGNGRSHWIAEGPLGKHIEWDAEIINDHHNELIAWRSIPGSELDTAGSVHFTQAPLNQGTIVKVSLKYNPPGGKAAASIASLLGAGLEQRVEEDLRRFKQTMEAGELPSVAGQPRGTCRGM